jgi:hypothetical protein
MPMFRRHRPEPGGGPGALRSSLADAAFAVEDYIVWPIREETAGWSRGTRAWSVMALVLLAVGGVAAGVAISDPSSSGTPVTTLAGPTRAGATGPGSAHHAPTGPILHGTAPTFAPEAGEGVPKSAESEVLRSEAGAHADSTTTSGAGEEVVSSGSDEGAAQTGPEVAGPAAIKVARRFADAFVLYEIGKTSAHVKKVFAETASPDLAKALLRRPPRLPSNVKVPKARVLNIVVGPTHDSTYTVSASLLRVGTTSELRLDMKRTPHWQVTDVTG